MPQVDLDGLTINYDVQGEGEPLLLIHYTSADHACWAFQLPAYTDHFSCIAIDLPGTGESDKPPGPYSTDGLADQVAAFLDAIGIEQAHVAGMSFGAAVGIHLAARHPGRVRLLPDDFDAQLDVRLWDRLFDLYVMDPMQRYIAQLLRTEAQRDALAMQASIDALGRAYDLIEGRMGEHDWAAGNDFSLADCAAAPALFYAAIVRPFSTEHVRLDAYFERLLARPSVWRCIVEARPVFQYYPLRHALPARFLDD